VIIGEAQELMQRLLSAQNPDGGWPYGRGLSWAEPTGFAVLALQPGQDCSTTPARDRAVAWLSSQQKPSGGWAPNAKVAECTSVTSVATLALLSQTKQQQSGSKCLDAALKWTAGQVYPDDFSLALLLARALNIPPAHAPGSVPWYPGTAGWVTPTSLSALVLSQAAHQRNQPELRQLADRCCAYLLSRRCSDDGWNHGGSKTRSEDSRSYPETTGLALLALRAASVSLPQPSVALAIKFAANPESLEGLSWIQLALESSGRLIPDPQRLPPPRTTRDCALRLIALRAREGKNVFLAQSDTAAG